MRVAIVGYGKMGHEIERLLRQRGHEVSLVIDVENTADMNAENLSGIDVAFEFTTPATAFSNIKICIESGVAVVCGTTAWLDKLEEIKAICKEHNGGFFYASNYSVGVNIMFKVNEMLAHLMNQFEEYDVTVEEVHHTQKKDAPSGTAITIAEGILKGLDRKAEWVGETTTEPDELEVVAIRRSVVPGTHNVTYESEIDQLTLCHTAKSRDGFVKGAVLAGEFLCGKKGVYSMDDLLGF